MNSYSHLVARHLGTDPAQLHFYWKGRIALYAALKAAKIGAGDEVIIPALTCVVVPNAIFYCQAKPVYADVRPDTLTLNPESVAQLIGPRTKAIIIQNTFGLSADVDRLVDMARSRGILALEDCTHGFGGSFQGKPNGFLADACFFSTQWNKPYSTGLGGFLCINRPELFPELDAVDRTAIAPSTKEVLSLRLSLLARRLLLTDASYWHLLRTYRWLSKTGLISGSSSRAETESTIMPEGFFKTHAQTQERAGIKSLIKLQEVIAMRRNAALAYRRVLSAHNKWHISEDYDNDNSHLKFPILARHRKSFFATAEKAGVRLSDWFVSPIHPIEGGFSTWGLNIESVPCAYNLSQKLLTVNTEVGNPTKVCEFLTKNIELIE